MIQTMSNPNDWLQFYHQNFPNQTLSPSDPDHSTTVVATNTNTVAAAATLPLEMGNSSSPTSSTHLGPDGRVSKPTRRRSRASRRTPTTLLNTDTTNFRAMVQQFTGGPSAPFAPSSSSLSLSSSAPSFSSLVGFGLGPRAIPPLNPPTMVSPPFYHHLQQQPQQQLLYQPQNQQHYNVYSGTTQGGGGDDTFFQRLISNHPRPPNNNAVADIHDGVLMEHGGFFPSTSSSS